MTRVLGKRLMRSTSVLAFPYTNSFFQRDSFSSQRCWLGYKIQRSYWEPNAHPNVRDLMDPALASVGHSATRQVEWKPTSVQGRRQSPNVNSSGVRAVPSKLEVEFQPRTD